MKKENGEEYGFAGRNMLILLLANIRDTIRSLSGTVFVDCSCDRCGGWNWPALSCGPIAQRKVIVLWELSLNGPEREPIQWCRYHAI